MRRGLGRGRRLIGIGAVIAIIGMPLAWLKVGGIVLAAETANGLEGPGVLVFLAGVGMLALIMLPFAMKNGRSSLDRPAAYLALLGLGLAGLVVAAFDVLESGGANASVTDVPGIWIGGFGMVVATWGVAELFAARGQES